MLWVLWLLNLPGWNLNSYILIRFSPLIKGKSAAFSLFVLLEMLYQGKNTWPSVSRTWLSHMGPERGSNHSGEQPNGLRVNSLIYYAMGARATSHIITISPGSGNWAIAAYTSIHGCSANMGWFVLSNYTYGCGMLAKLITHMSHLMTKPTWHVCPAKTQINLGICSIWLVFAEIQKSRVVSTVKLTLVPASMRKHLLVWILFLNR